MIKSSLLTIVTRNSPMAIWQAEYVKRLLNSLHTDLTINIIKHSTKGDKIQDKSLAKVGGKDLFVKELQKVLLQKKAHLAVHCVKDMSVNVHKKLTIAAFLKRDDVRDAFVSNQYNQLRDLPTEAVIGTASPRRQCLIHILRPDLKTKLIRGNVNTRLNKLDNHEYDAIILAAAGLKRLELESRIKEYFDPTTFIPAIGQGVLCIECRNEDEATQALVAKLDDPPTRLCVTSERAVNRKLGGNCFTPIGAYATLNDDKIELSAIVGSVNGKRVLKSKAIGSKHDAESLGLHVAEDLLSQGAADIIK